MRERLVAALAGMTIAMIVMYGIPRAYLLADLVTTQENAKVGRSADLMAALVEERVASNGSVSSQFLQTMLADGEVIEYVAPAGNVVRAGPEMDGESDLAHTRDLADGASLTLAGSEELLAKRISEALVPLIAIGAALIVFAAFIGYLLARRLARPFGELAQAADHLGRARFDVHFPHYSIPEAEAIGSALRRASSQLDELVRREREFAANASHQLRTPITALRLQLEDLSMWPETPPQVAEELLSYLSELDRLSDSITEILDLARGRRLGDTQEVDLSELVDAVVERWRPSVEAAGHTLVHQDRGPMPARVVPGPVVQVLDVLVHNACMHGAGEIVVRVNRTDEVLRLRVADQGPRTIDDSVFGRGTSARDSEGAGLGLAIASDLATSMGGYLSLLDEPTTTFELALPAKLPQST